MWKINVTMIQPFDVKAWHRCQTCASYKTIQQFEIKSDTLLSKNKCKTCTNNMKSNTKLMVLC